jgi:hypothetical protein
MAGVYASAGPASQPCRGRRSNSGPPSTPSTSPSRVTGRPAEAATTSYAPAASKPSNRVARHHANTVRVGTERVVSMTRYGGLVGSASWMASSPKLQPGRRHITTHTCRSSADRSTLTGPCGATLDDLRSGEISQNRGRVATLRLISSDLSRVRLDLRKFESSTQGTYKHTSDPHWTAGDQVTIIGNDLYC